MHRSRWRKEFAGKVLIAQNGDVVELSHQSPKVVEQVDVGRTFVHGKGVGDIGHDVLRDRRMLAEVGIVTVVLVVERESGRLVVGPDLTSKGLTFEEVEPELMEGARLPWKSNWPCWLLQASNNGKMRKMKSVWRSSVCQPHSRTQTLVQTIIMPL